MFSKMFSESYYENEYKAVATLHDPTNPVVYLDI